MVLPGGARVCTGSDRAGLCLLSCCWVWWCWSGGCWQGAEPLPAGEERVRPWPVRADLEDALAGVAAGHAGSFSDASFVVGGVVLGSTAWWLALTTVVGLLHAKVDEKVRRIINRACGALVMACGLAVLIHLAIKFWRF